MTVAVTTSLLSQSTAVAVGGLVSCIVLFVLVLLCVCGDSEKRKEDEIADIGKSVGGTFIKNESLDPHSVVINVENGVQPVENGRLPPEPGSRSSYRSSGSSPQPGGHRELPAPPTSSLNSSLKTPDDDDEEDADYDHLTTSKSLAKRASNYDHIKMSAEGKVLVEEHKTPEHFYSEVKSKKEKANVITDRPLSSANTCAEDEEGDYDTLNEGSDGSMAEVKRVSVVKVISVEDPYAKLKEEGSGGSCTDIDPYSKVKDDPYSKFKDDFESDSGQSFNPYSKVKDDPYSKVKEDPYSKVKDDPYSKVKDDPQYSGVKDYDPYNRVDDDMDSLANSQIEDPYNKVNERDMESGASGTSTVIDAYASVEPRSTRTNQVTRINVTKSANISHNGTEFNVVENTTNEYAVVMKSRSDTTPTPTSQHPFTFQSQETDPYMLPPEPPRRYNEYAEPDDALLGGAGSQRSSVQVDSTRSSLVQISSQRSSLVQIGSQRSSLVQNDLSSPDQAVTAGAGAAGAGAAGTTQQTTQKREPPYHKITARESLASINQRLARNTYETVAETVADQQAEAATLPLLENFYATVEGGSGDGVVTNQGNHGSRNRLNQSPCMDHYAEIGATGGRSHNVPAPPSLDSLHIMTKSADGRLPNGAGSPVEMESNSNHRRTLSNQETVTLDPNYQTVRDCISDMAASSDPNYESVQEAESRRPFSIVTKQNGTKLIREHFYEEVKPASEADNVKKRVLRSHMYEDIDDVKEQKKQLKKNPKHDDVWKRRSDAENN